jgi:predicted Rossmann fold flavoprotein
MTYQQDTYVIIGGGAAGFFGALACAEQAPDARVIILEKHRQLLAKVRISGGGRCNVTHHCFDPLELIKNYPRGHKALRGPFARFQPRDTVDWFESRGVTLKAESDGRMFPTTDSSETIINCFKREAERLGVIVRTECGVEGIERSAQGFHVRCSDDDTIDCKAVLLASGSGKQGLQLAESLGHTLVPQVPSLFTFNVPTSPLSDLQGVSVEAADLSIFNTPLKQTGPLLITHWGFSGPAVLKLSAWGARILHDLHYQATLCVCWLPGYSVDAILQQLRELKTSQGAKTLHAHSPFPALSRKLWQRLVETCDIHEGVLWAQLSRDQLQKLAHKLGRDLYAIDGKTTYKQEFVTCGGVHLDEVNFTTMESKKCPGLHFAGEILDIDGVTGGFNFQAAWSTSWIAGQAMAKQ